MKHPFNEKDLTAAIYAVSNVISNECRNLTNDQAYELLAKNAIQAAWDSAVARGAVQQTGSFVKPTEISGYFIKLPEDNPKPNAGFSVLKLPEDKT